MNRCFKPCFHAPFKVYSPDYLVSPDTDVTPDYSFLVGSKRQPWYIRFRFWLKHFLKRILYEQ